MKKFIVHSDYTPSGDQPKAIEQISKSLNNNNRFQCLQGVTGAGKTYTMAKIIEQINKPTLILSHNKTLAAQLYREFAEFFPHNAVEYFVSYFDYYQPEAYIAARDLYIEKDSSVNAEIERMRLSATTSLQERNDVLIVATVSCIYGLGSADIYRKMRIRIDKNTHMSMQTLRMKLIELQYTRVDASIIQPGEFRIRGELCTVFPPYAKIEYRIRIEWDEISELSIHEPISNNKLESRDTILIYPSKHFVLPEEQIAQTIPIIEAELATTHAQLLNNNRIIEAQRLKSRTEYDIEMLKEMHYCSGIENYSRHLTGRAQGERPGVLLDYFPDDFITFIDESHVTLPQFHAMYAGDRSRKISLVEHGFRLPSAMDNRPLQFDEFITLLPQVTFVSATPTQYEKENSAIITELIIRPTGLLDPKVIIQKSDGQMEHLYNEICTRIAVNERVIITTLTKKMAEELTKYLQNMGLAVTYLHSDITTIERVEKLTALRKGDIHVIIGINLLREGIDLPEVSLVAILDADKIGFLRSTNSLIQTIGRAARNVNGTVIMYCDTISDAMKHAIAETKRRRTIQKAYNEKHNITPQTIQKAITDILVRKQEQIEDTQHQTIDMLKQNYNLTVAKERQQFIVILEKQMLEHAKNYEFEQAAVIRDEIADLRNN